MEFKYWTSGCYPTAKAFHVDVCVFHLSSAKVPRSTSAQLLLYFHSRSRSKSSQHIVLATVLVLTLCRYKLCRFKKWRKKIITEDVDWFFYSHRLALEKNPDWELGFSVMSASGMRHKFYGKHRDFHSNRDACSQWPRFLLCVGNFIFPRQVFAFITCRKWSSHYNALHQLASLKPL